jgi:glycosyltransferase involved in cell wall biosynthesis
VRHGETGFLAREHADWLAQLERLAADAALRRRIAAAARQEVVERFALTRVSPRLVALLRGVLAVSGS